MQSQKKLYTVAITAFLLLSLVFAVMPLASAIEAPTVEPDTGPVGEEVKVNGTSTTPGGKIEVYWDEVHAWDAEAGTGLLGYKYAKADKSYEFNFTVPEAVAGSHGVIVKDVEAAEINGTATYTVTSKIEISPEVGLPDDTVDVEGTGFDGEADITIIFWNGTSWPSDAGINKTVATTTSNSLGSFTKSFEVPTCDDRDYNVTAWDGTHAANATFTVSHLFITLDPTKGSVGTEVTVKGRGFTKSSTVDIYFGTHVYPAGFYTKVKSDVGTTSAGEFTTTFYVPSCAADDYVVTAFDAEEVYANATFTVSPEHAIELDKKTGFPEAEVEVTGYWFTEDSTVDIYFDLEVLAEDVETDEDGNFTETVTIPEDAAKGAHTIKVVDAEGLTATAKFTVTEKVTFIGPRRSGASPPIYRQGETVSFYVNSTVDFDTPITLKISDPDGYPYDTLTLVSGEIEGDGFYVVPYSNATFTLPSDALLGDWNWTATYEMEGEEFEDTGLFTVAVMPYDAMLTKLDELDASLVSLDDDVAILSTDVGDVKVSVDAIGLEVVDITDGIATIETKVGTIEGKVTSIDGTVATIKTDIGTVKADVSTVKGYFPVTVAVDMTPAWIAVVLSLIAAIAAIAAVFTITRKIAG